MVKVPAAFWSRSIINLLRVGIGIYIGASNQYSEGNFKHKKAKKDLYLYLSEPALYMIHMSDEQGKLMHLFVSQYEEAELIIARRNVKKNKKKKKGGLIKKTEDAIENEKFNTESTGWGTGKCTWAHEEKVRRQMIKIFEKLNVTGRPCSGCESRRNILIVYHDTINNVGSMDGMAKSTWATFISGKRDKSRRVGRQNMILFEKFVEYYYNELELSAIDDFEEIDEDEAENDIETTGLKEDEI